MPACQAKANCPSKIAFSAMITTTTTQPAIRVRIALANVSITLARLRGERRFDSAEELVAQMQRDVEQARAICAG